MSTFKNKNSLRTIEAEFPKKLRTMRLGQNLLVLIKKKKACRPIKRNRIESDRSMESSEME